MFFSKPKSYLGVDLGAHGIKLVELEEEKNRPVLFTYGNSTEKKNIHKLFDVKEKTAEDLVKDKTAPKDTKEELPNPEDQKQIMNYAADLKAVCKAAKVVSKSATASLPISSVFHAVVNLPQLEKK